jgi:hypothetical protein
MVVYDSASIYITSATTTEAKITRIDAIITALLTAAETGALNEDKTSYMLDDGQTKINVAYKGVDAIMKSIQNFETLKTYYQNQLNGRVMRFVDGKNFRRNG